MNFSSKKNVLVNLVRSFRPISFEGFHTSRTSHEKNYYDVLNVKSDCSPKEIRDSFIDLAKKHHPDANQNDPKSHARFVELQKAYSILSAPSKRHDYDVGLRSPYQSRPGRRPMEPTDDDSRYYHDHFSDEFKEFYYRSQRHTDPNPPAQVGAFKVTVLLLAFTTVGAFLQYIFLRWLYRRNFNEEMERHHKATASYHALKQEMDKRSEEYDIGKLRAAYFKEINGLVAMHLVPDLIRPELPSARSKGQNVKVEVSSINAVQVPDKASTSVSESSKIDS
ncbi:dnaJ-like protein 60 [Thrips palmi]|uniref:DnaJ-like protein 60 n=1 Tax=Thrips palmi TaxID=161013 RepID=A0A6P8YLL3_THRPL|nr:dnaJ-like protein 60 [Thrips palmi]